MNKIKFEDTILRIEEYKEGFVGYTYTTLDSDGRGCGHLDLDFRDKLIDLYLQTARFEISNKINKGEQVSLKVLLGIN